MSVLIKGLEMPETEYMDIRIYRDGTAVIALGKKPYYREFKAEPVRHAKLLIQRARKAVGREERRMSDYTRRNEADELREQLNHCRDYIAELEMKCKELTEKLREANLAVEHNRHLADEEQHKSELRYRDGMIAGLKYATRCNGVSGGEVQ